MTDGKFSMPFHITSYDVSQTGGLKYSNLFRLLQEAAGQQMEAQGLSYDRMRGAGVVFLLTRAAFQIDDLPQSGDDVVLETWFEGNEGAQYVRDMRLLSRGGRAFATCRSFWVTVDPVSHRILRPSSFPFPGVFLPCPAGPVAVEDGKIASLGAETPFPAVSREVRWSDIDCNGHMNNAVYADVFCDCFPGGLGQKRLKTLKIEFHHEATEGGKLSIRARLSGGVAVMEGAAEDHVCFRAEAEVSDI